MPRQICSIPRLYRFYRLCRVNHTLVIQVSKVDAQGLIKPLKTISNHLERPLLLCILFISEISLADQ